MKSEETYEHAYVVHHYHHVVVEDDGHETVEPDALTADQRAEFEEFKSMFTNGHDEEFAWHLGDVYGAVEALDDVRSREETFLVLRMLLNKYQTGVFLGS